MLLKEALALSSRLDSVSESASLDLALLLCHVLAKPQSYLYTWPERALDAQQERCFLQLLQRREAGEPVAHLTGSRGFWTLELEVNATTLIPRPDTECLVEKALALLTQDSARVLDLGTGSGAIALALASEQPGWQVVGVDRIAEAVALAGKNATRLGIANVELLLGDWLAPVRGQFDMIVSNPPYIDPHDPHLAQGDVRFEPLSALVAEDAGLADIRRIAEQSRDYLLPGGWLLFEHGYDQAQRVRQLLLELGYSAVDSGQDLAGNDRITWGAWMTENTRAE